MLSSSAKQSNYHKIIAHIYTFPSYSSRLIHFPFSLKELFRISYGEPKKKAVANKKKIFNNKKELVVVDDNSENQESQTFGSE